MFCLFRMKTEFGIEEEEEEEEENEEELFVFLFSLSFVCVYNRRHSTLSVLLSECLSTIKYQIRKTRGSMFAFL